MLITMSIVPVDANKTTETQCPQKTHSAIQYDLGSIIVKWEWAFQHWPPIVNFIINNQTEFIFPEINGTLQMNFSVTCQHRMDNRLVFPRWTRFVILIWYKGDYIWNYQSKFYHCPGNLLWDYHNVTLDQTNQIFPIVTMGQNATLKVQFWVYGFPPAFLVPVRSNIVNITVFPE